MRLKKPTCAELPISNTKGLYLQLKRVEDEGFGDVVALLCVTHVGATD